MMTAIDYRKLPLLKQIQEEIERTKCQKLKNVLLKFTEHVREVPSDTMHIQQQVFHTIMEYCPMMIEEKPKKAKAKKNS